MGLMRPSKITKGGQVSVPADIRHRWSTSRVMLEDLGDRLVIHPAADDPVGALRGAFVNAAKPGSDELRRSARDDEHDAQARRV